ncbi:hypothetical protein IMSAGC015_00341 [Lachnospiraceae bacterium]|jgi:hypothetical protein|nr:hypothetical protein [Dorea sp.]GFI36182.1 hypothetical protein IMSAGC015_00341 [Lachnospiraceae bacterium]
MLYSYITEDNLENKQNYMYSTYSGTPFLEEYVKIRQDYCEKAEKEDRTEGYEVETDPTLMSLMLLDGEYRLAGMNESIRGRVDLFVKTFEVRKRIYTEYEESWKPEKDAGYRNYDSYLVLGDILNRVWEDTGCTKYVSCLMKINDTLLSVSDRLKPRQKKQLAENLRKELKIFWETAEKLSLDLSWRENICY